MDDIPSLHNNTMSTQHGCSHGRDRLEDLAISDDWEPMNNRRIMLNAFLPASEQGDPARFAGRSREIRMLADSLHTEGSTPIIFGDRGLGKSSLAAQLQLIAGGNSTLLKHIDAERLALADEETFLPFSLTCTDLTKTLDDLVQLMLNATENIDLGTGATQTLSGKQERFKFGVKFAEAEITKNYTTEVGRISYVDLSNEEKLIQVCEIITKIYGKPVLFIIDELDRMQNTEGLASFLKAYSTENLKFVLVGIASNVSDLLADHRSMERKVTTVHVRVMEPFELAQIIRKAETYLDENGFAFTFSDEAITTLISISSGFPWFIHLLGQECLRLADDQGITVISDEQAFQSVVNIVTDHKAQQYEDKYRMAVKSSSSREKTLLMMAHWKAQDIPTGQIYTVLNRYLGVTSGPGSRTQLMKDEFGAVLYDPKLSTRGLVRFRDEMFKAYVRMRPSIYTGAREEVIAAYEAITPD